MELDELKKTWNLLDEKLKQETLADSRQIEALIASCKDRAGRGVDSLARNQRLSMWLGGVVGVVLLVVGGLFSFLLLEGPVRLKMLVLLLFSALSIAIGVLWDRKTFQWLRQLKAAGRTSGIFCRCPVVHGFVGGYSLLAFGLSPS